MPKERYLALLIRQGQILARRDAGMFTPGAILQTVYDNFGPFSGNIGIAPGAGGLGRASGALMTAEGYAIPFARTYNPSMALAPALALSNSTATTEPKKGGSKPNETGQQAEKAANADPHGAREHYDGPISGKPRIADISKEKTLGEIKNVAYQYLSTQIKDAIAFAKITGRQFVLYLRESTKISKPLAEQIKKGNVKRRKIPDSK